jgi:hypothetical protein
MDFIMIQLKLMGDPRDQDRYEALKPNFMKVVQIINFEAFRPVLDKTLGRKVDPLGRGRRPFDCVLMFKILILQHFYTLSDDAMEFMLRDRQSFKEFVGLHKNALVPDAKTIWLFRQKLVEASALQPLFDQTLSQIDAFGFIAQGGQIVDATIMESRKPGKQRAPEGVDALCPAQQRQIDPHATFTKKGDKSYHGYKGHINIDNTHKMVRKIHITTASSHDSQAVEALMDLANTKSEFHGDSAYKSQTMDAVLDSLAIKNRIVRRAYRNKPLNGHDKRFNKTSSRTRSRVEHVFGQVKLWGAKIQVRSMGLARATLGIGLQFLAYNMNRLRFYVDQKTEAASF